MNQKKAKAIRREMRKLNGHTKSLKTVIIEYPAFHIVGLSEFRRAVRIGLQKKQTQLKKMGVKVPFAILIARIVKETPPVGHVFKGMAKRLQADEPRRAYQGEKKLYLHLKKKQRAGRYV